LVRENLPAALRFAIRLTGDADHAEELVQESLIRVADRWATFRGESTFQTWFFRIIINLFRDSLSRTSLAVVSIEDNDSELFDLRGESPPDACLNAELGQQIAQEVSRLPPRQREVLILVAFEKLSTSEVAKLLEISEDNVHSTLSAARARLKDRLAGYLGARRE
jgi:RNA polymerase sigma-70 factor (ECF subfamily)